MTATVYKCSAATCRHRELNDDDSRKCLLDEITISGGGDCQSYEPRSKEET